MRIPFMDMQAFGADEILLLVALFALPFCGFIQAIYFLISASEDAFRRMFLSVAGAAGLLALLILCYGGAA